MRFSRADDRMKRGLREEIFTAAALLVAKSTTIVFQQTYGTLGGTGTDAVKSDTLFDLASLTKVLAVTPSWILMAAEDPSLLDQSIGRWFPNTRPDKHCITPRCLLAHASGLAGLEALLSAAYLPTHQRRHRDKNPGGTSGIFSRRGFCLFRPWVHALGLHY